MAHTFKAAAIAASILLAGAATPALAQRAAAAPTINVAVADPDAVIQGSAAFTLAAQQVQTTYAPQITNLNTRRQALITELQPLETAVRTEQGRTPQNATALAAAENAYRTRAAAAQAELNTLQAPIELAIAYVREQITLRLGDAVQAAVAARRVDVLVSDGAVLWNAPAANLNAAIITELNRLVPNVQIVPPAGYQPGQLLRAQQQAQATTPAATPTVPAAQPQTR